MVEQIGSAMRKAGLKKGDKVRRWGCSAMRFASILQRKSHARATQTSCSGLSQVCIYGVNSPEWMVTMQACNRMGLVCVPGEPTRRFTQAGRRFTPGSATATPPPPSCGISHLAQPQQCLLSHSNLSTSRTPAVYDTLGPTAAQYILQHSEAKAAFVSAAKVAALSGALPKSGLAVVVHWGAPGQEELSKIPTNVRTGERLQRLLMRACVVLT